MVRLGLVRSPEPPSCPQPCPLSLPPVCATARWRQYRFHVEEEDEQVVISVAMESDPAGGGRASFDLFLKSEQPAGEVAGSSRLPG